MKDWLDGDTSLYVYQLLPLCGSCQAKLNFGLIYSTFYHFVIFLLKNIKDFHKDFSTCNTDVFIKQGLLHV